MTVREKPATKAGRNLLANWKLHPYICDLNVQITEGDPDFYDTERWTNCSCGLRDAVLAIEREAKG